jgi:hypothetical protein
MTKKKAELVEGNNEDNEEILSHLKFQFKELAEHLDKNKNNTTKHANRYSNELKACAVALRATGLSYEKIAELLHIQGGKNTIRYWCNMSDHNKMLGGRYSDLVSQVKKNLSSKAYLLSNTILGAISDKDIETASLASKVTSSAILIDKGRLLDGDSTENHLHFIKKQVEIKASIDKDQEEIKIMDKEIESIKKELDQYK